MEGARNRRCGESQNIDVCFQLFDFFFVCDPEALFLIDYQKPEVFVDNVF